MNKKMLRIVRPVQCGGLFELYSGDDFIGGYPTLIDAANEAYLLVDSGEHEILESWFHLYSAAKSVDISALRLQAFDESGFNVDEFVSDKAPKIQELVKRHDFDIYSPVEVLLACSGDVELSQYAVWAFKHYGTVSLALNSEQLGRVRNYLDEFGYKGYPLCFQHLEHRDEGVRRVIVGDDVRLLMREIDGILQVKITANTKVLAAEVDYLFEYLKSLKRSVVSG